ncbi:MAG: hypothetical protein H6R06_4047 [Proteobacteria bacterium]|jgi:hypothetical protein|nr:hypothetical protein [Pseudomonadota bacterium]
MNSTDLTRSQALPPWRIQWPALRRVTEAFNASARRGALLGVLLTAGCAGIERAPQPEALPQAAPAATTVSVEPKAVAPVPPTQAKAAERVATVDKATQPSVVPSASPAQGAAKAAAAPPKAPAKPAATPSAAAPPAKSETPAVAPAKVQAAAPLDLKSLETRLKETQAIGVFTKLTLKNQIDALLDQFRAFYQGKLKTSLADLRRSYDMLVLKVLALLQDADPPLASAIAGSREAIWGILSNPAKFAAV